LKKIHDCDIINLSKLSEVMHKGSAYQTPNEKQEDCL